MSIYFETVAYLDISARLVHTKNSFGLIIIIIIIIIIYFPSGTVIHYLTQFIRCYYIT
jgi:hypothetical protein